ncbi:MAG: hypothetical protein IJS37_04215 [Bacilli bacterium]|nr:hypothetical protein [Bacilli bacterium]
MGKEVYAVIDLKSFYASCECAARGLDIFSTPLVVADKSRSQNSIVMSATPFLKARYGVPNVCRIGDLPDVPNMIFATPRMSYYVEMSAKVVSLFLNYVAEEDLHVYSIDESFLRLTPYLKLNNCDAETLVGRIQKDIMDQFGLTATCGMGPNMFLAKACLDNEGKKRPPYRAYWGEKDIKTKLWAISPITKVWGINRGISGHLHRLGIRSLEALAKADVKLLNKEFGIMGYQLHNLANGIDETDITVKYVPKDTSLTQGQVLMRDYSALEGELILKETVDELCVRLRKANQMTSCVSIYVGYASTEQEGGFHHQCALNVPTDDNDELYACLLVLYRHYVGNRKIRNLSIAFSKLRSYDSPSQLSFLNDQKELEEKRSLRLALDFIAGMYGKNAVLRASSLTDASTIKERHGYIGGHRA